MQRASSINTIDDLRPGHHICSIYRTDEEQREVLSAFMKTGFERGEKLLYIADKRSARTVMDLLRTEGFDPDACVRDGRLDILTSDEAYLSGGRFDPERMIGLLKEATEKSLRDGYTALRATGEMTWVLRGLPGSETFFDYEEKLDEFFTGSRCIGLCQYDRRSFPPELLLSALRVHPVIFIGAGVYDNFFYNPPRGLMREGSQDSVLNNRLSCITERRRADTALKTALQQAFERELKVSELLIGPKPLIEQDFFRQTARGIFDTAKTLIGAQSGYVALLSQSGEENEVLFLDAGGLPCTVDPNLPMPVRGLRGESYRLGETVYDNNFANSHWMKFMPEGHVNLDNVLFAPVKSGDKTIGLVGLANKPGGFDDRDARLASSFADSVAISLLSSQSLSIIKQREDRYRRLFEQSNDAVIIHDSAGNVFNANTRACEVMGCDKTGMIKMSVSFLLPDACGEERMKKSGGEGEPLYFDTSFTRPDGSVVELEVSSSIIDPDNGLIQSVARNITRRKQIERALRESEANLREAQQIASLGRWELDIVSQNLWWSQGIYDLFEIAPASFKPSYDAFLDFIHPEDRAEVDIAYTSSVRNRKPYEIVHRLLMPDGRTKWVRENGRTEYDANGAPLRSIGTVQDVTSLKKAEEDIQRLLDQVMEINRQLEEFAFTVSHDLKAPLVTIAGFAGVLAESQAITGEDREYLNRISAAAEKMNTLIGHVLEISRIGRTDTAPEQVPFREVVTEAVMSLKPLVKKMNVDLRIESADVTINANRLRMIQVFENLIVNAIKYIGSGNPNPVVEVGVRSEGGRNVFFVRDNGIGIDKKFHDDIFNIFRRLEGAAGIEGNGVGLAIVKKIIETQGDRIWLESEPGRGSTFYFTV